jgi:CO/xanthine dehydrogenase Mo-binding subunit
MGEGGILPVAPAIGNAVFAAVGTRLLAAPLTPDLVWKAMNIRS